MSEQKPEAVWVFPEETKKRGPRIALTALLVGLVLLVTLGLVIFFIPHSADERRPSATPSASLPTSTPAVSPSPAPDPARSPSAPPPPDLSTFRDAVVPRLDSITSGIATLRGSADPSGTQVIENMRGALQRMADLGAPSEISPNWSTLLSQLDSALQRAQVALSAGTEATTDLDAASSVIDQMRKLIGD